MQRRDVLAGIASAGGLGAIGVMGYETVASQPSAAGNQTETTPTSTPAFEPDVSWPSCESVTVDADSYGSVYLILEDESQTEISGPHSGANTFEADLVIKEILVYGDSSTYDEPNPAYSTCVATPTETATDRPTPTETATETPIPKMDLETDSWTTNEGSENETFHLSVKATNPYERAFSVRLFVTLRFSDAAGSPDLPDKGAVLDPGESESFYWDYEGSHGSFTVTEHEVEQSTNPAS